MHHRVTLTTLSALTALVATLATLSLLASSTPPAQADTALPSPEITLWSEDFDAGIPETWTVTGSPSTSLRWTDLAASGESANYTGGHGDAATASSDHFGAGRFDAELRTPPFDLPVAAAATLHYRASYQR